jgi:peptide/nickel transport system substrate-binding protein
MFHKKRIYTFLAVLLAFTLLIGCVGQAPPSEIDDPTEESIMPTEEGVKPTEEVAEPTQPIEEIGRDATFIIGVDGDLEGWDPATSTYYAVNDMIQAVYDTLVVPGIKTDDKGRMIADTTKFEPRLAKDWEVSDDGTLWTFYLRDDVIFHSGNPLTSADVKYSFDRSINLDKGILLTMLQVMGVTRVDQLLANEPYEFQIQLDEPNNLVLSLLSIVANSVILDSELVQANVTADDPFAENWLRSNTAGSGPYKLEEYVVGDRAVYTTFTDYWDDQPAMKRIIYKTIPSAQDRILLLINGDIDMAYNVPGIDITTTLQGVSGVMIESYPAPSTTVFFVNNTQPPYDDVRVRKALCHAVPYDGLIDNVLYGLGTKSPGPVAPGVAYSMDVNECTYDLEIAQALLTEAGLSDGFDMVLTYREGRPEEEASAIFLQAELAKINIKVELEKILSSAWNERRSAKTIMAGLDGYTPYAPTPIYVMNFWYITDAVLNTWVYSNERVDELATLGRTTFDDSLIEQYMTEMLEIISEEQPVVWLFNPYWNVVMRDDIQGYVFYADRFTRHYYLTR